MTAAKEERAAKKAARDLAKQVAELRKERQAIRSGALPWGTPYCARPGGPYCQGYGCEGCAMRTYEALLLADVDERMANLTDPPPAPLEGELLSLVGGRWVLA